MAENSTEKTGRFASACARIDQQAPSLKYLGLAFWMAWNAIAFSGSFWLRDTENNLRSENLILVHLAACIITLLVFGLTSKRTARWIPKRDFVIGGGCVAMAGTLLIVVAREDLLHSAVAFNLGSVCSGIGTTALFPHAVPLFGALPPRRACSLLACSSLLSSAVYFALDSCENDIATAGFVALPLLSMAFFAIGGTINRKETTVLVNDLKLTRPLIAFFASICLCSFAFEFAKASVLIALPPSFSASSSVASHFMGVFIMIAIIVATLLERERYNYGKYYSYAVFILALLLFVIATAGPQSIQVAAFATAACNCFNLIVWAIFAYLVFQAQAGSIRIFALGNAALSAGTALASLFITIVHSEPSITDEMLRIALVILGMIVLVDLVFVFSERQINELLAPLDRELKAQDTLGSPALQPKQWVLTCESIAKSQGLSEREQEVFVALARGKTAQEIADKDVLSVYTVRAHIRSIYAKLDVHSKKELVKFVEDHLER